MKLNKIYIIFLILIICLVVAAGYFLKINTGNISQPLSLNKNEKPITQQKFNNKKAIAKKSADKLYKEINFKSNEEIREEYGKLETVATYAGREYTGAVISIDEFYTIVTLDGKIKIPMRDVKSRIIIK